MKKGTSKDITPLVLQLGIFLTLLIVIFFQQERPFFEYPVRVPVFYLHFIYQFRIVDILVIGMFMFVFLSKSMLRKKFFIQNPLRKPLLLSIVAIPIPFFIGLYKGETELFHDWRELVLGIMFFYTFLNVINTRQKVMRFVWLFFFIIVCYGFYGLLKYVVGKGITQPVTGYVPFYSGAELITLVAAFLLGISLLVFGGARGLKAVFVALASIVLFLGIILSLRRVIWGATLLGLAIIFYLTDRPEKVKYSIFGILFIGFALTIISSGIVPLNIENTTLRIASMNPFTYSASFAETNKFHIEDIIDAFHLTIKHPIFGIGLGIHRSRYITAYWNNPYPGVHNGPLNTWMRFGILGLMAYLWIVFSFLKHGLRNLRTLSTHSKGISVGLFSFVIGYYFMTFGFGCSPWESFQKMTLLFFGMASIFILTELEKEQI